MKISLKSAEKNKSVAKRSFILTIIGFAFFINPVPLGLDFLPDVFGCAFLVFGLTQLAYFDGAVEQARKCIIYLFVVEAFKLLMTRSLVLTEIGSNRMLGATVFSILQGILYIAIFKQLFSGISYFSMRNNCNTALALCDGTAFLTYLAFFVRIAATLIPELVALIEIYLSGDASTAMDFDELELIESLVSSKLILVVMLSLVALITGIAWFISVCKLFKALYSESASELDARYGAEYLSRPEKVRPKTIRHGSYVIYVALFFALDIKIDTARIVPASVMFLGLFIAAFMLSGISKFGKTKIFAPIAFALMLCAELHHQILVPYGAIVIYETHILTVITGALLGIAAAVAGLLCIRCFLCEMRALQSALGGSEVSIFKPWLAYCVTVSLWIAGYAVPYFYNYFAVARFFAACVFIWQAAKLVSFINEEEQARFIMLGK